MVDGRRSSKHFPSGLYRAPPILRLRCVPIHLRYEVPVFRTVRQKLPKSWYLRRAKTAVTTFALLYEIVSLRDRIINAEIRIRAKNYRQ